MVEGFQCIKYADSWINECHVFPGGSKEKMIPITFMLFLIKTGNRLVLVDAGCETMPNFKICNFISPKVALNRLGVSESNITDVIITHSHHDHIEAVKYFSNSIIHIQKEEYNIGKTYIPADFKVNLFNDEYVIDNSVKVIKIGGHSIGSCIVEFEFQDKTYVVCGDECYSHENLNKHIPTGSSYCFSKSCDFIDKYSNDKYVCLLCHNE